MNHTDSQSIAATLFDTDAPIGDFIDAAHESFIVHGVRDISHLWRREEQLPANEHRHSCSNPELGAFIRSNSIIVGEANGIKQFATIFTYEGGAVVWNSQKQWTTLLDKDPMNYEQYCDALNKAIC